MTLAATLRSGATSTRSTCSSRYWLYVTRADGTLEGALTAEAPLRVFNVVDAHGVHSVDPQNKVHNLIAAAHEDTEIFPLTQELQRAHAGNGINSVGRHAEGSRGADNLERQLVTFLAANPSYRGLNLDLEDLPDDAQAGL